MINIVVVHMEVIIIRELSFDKNWGLQFTPQIFQSSGQSWEDYSALRVKLGFLNGNSGPTEYGRYLPIGWMQF